MIGYQCVQTQNDCLLDSWNVIVENIIYFKHSLLNMLIRCNDEYKHKTWMLHKSLSDVSHLFVLDKSIDPSLSKTIFLKMGDILNMPFPHSLSMHCLKH